MKIAIHQIQYMPGPRFFNKMKNCDLFVFLDDVQYEKREFQNRNKIRTAKGWQYLTVPVKTKGKRFQRINEVEINNSYEWRAEHRKAIKINYSNSGFFGEYSPAIERIYSREYFKLADISMESITFMKEAFKIKTPFEFSSRFDLKTSSSQKLVDLCLALGAGEYLSGAGGKNYLDERLFAKSGIRLSYQNYEYPKYRQVFPGFESNMSALDLLLNSGGERAGQLLV